MAKKRREVQDGEIGAWFEREIAGCQFDDRRHGKRFRTLVEQLAAHIGGSIPFASQDWASTKAAYRFLANGKVSEEQILAGPFMCTRERFAAASGAPVLILHDTTEFIYLREDNQAISIFHNPHPGYV